MQTLLKNQRGMTLVEAMIAVSIFAVGILAVATMQTLAMRSSSTAFERTSANSVALSVLETIKQLPFDNPNLTDTGSLNNDANTHNFSAATLPELAPLLQVPSGGAAGTIMDQSRIVYQLTWAVQDTILPSGGTPYKTIRLFMTWLTPTGQNRLEMVTVKYNNLILP
ncbi:MAG: type IV pilus modification PilV family protein [Thermodesulfobacteriota bacterium]